MKRKHATADEDRARQEDGPPDRATRCQSGKDKHDEESHVQDVHARRAAATNQFDVRQHRGQRDQAPRTQALVQLSVARRIDSPTSIHENENRVI